MFSATAPCSAGTLPEGLERSGSVADPVRSAAAAEVRTGSGLCCGWREDGKAASVAALAERLGVALDFAFGGRCVLGGDALLVLGAKVGDADLAEPSRWIGALSTGPVEALRGAKLRRARSSNRALGAVIVASADIRRRTLGLPSSGGCGAGDASLDA